MKENPLKNSRFGKPALIVASAAFLSRISGFARDVLIALFLGAGLVSDIFFAAFRIFDFTRKIFAEGCLNFALVPFFTRRMAEKGKKSVFDSALSIAKFFFIFFFILTCAGIVFSPQIVSLITPGFTQTAYKLHLMADTMRIMFPYLLFAGLTALFMAVFNSFNSFFIPSIMPLILNLTIIAGLLTLKYAALNPILWLGCAVAAGGMLQFVFQIPFLMNKGFNFQKKGSIFPAEIKKPLRTAIPAVFSAAVYQINSIIGTAVGSFLSQGTVSYLYYADRLVQFPGGIFAAAAGISSLPLFSKQVSDNDIQQLKSSFIKGIKTVLFIAVPAMTGIILLRREIVSVLFERGAFNIQAAFATQSALFYYSFSIWAIPIIRITAGVLYSFDEILKPALAACAAVFFNAAASLILINYMGHNSIALSCSLSMFLNAAIFLILTRAKLGPFFKEIMPHFFKTVICSAVMGLCIIYLLDFMQKSRIHKIPALFICIIIGIVVYAAVFLISRRNFLYKFGKVSL